MRILTKLLHNDSQCTDDANADDIHHVECAACGIQPIVQTDRYRCLECSSSSIGYDLCGRCFEKRRQTGRHKNGHAMVHFKMPDEFLGIPFDSSSDQLHLQRLSDFSTLQNERHDDITCDGGCGRKNFLGIRFKCDSCPNYNLCRSCAIDRRVTTKMHQNDHPIILTSNRVIPKIPFDDIQLGDVLGRGAFGKLSVFHTHMSDF
jgi:hypothetical protein